jgi:hypothetical protein
MPFGLGHWVSVLVPDCEQAPRADGRADPPTVKDDFTRDWSQRSGSLQHFAG